MTAAPNTEASIRRLISELRAALLLGPAWITRRYAKLRILDTLDHMNRIESWRGSLTMGRRIMILGSGGVAGFVAERANLGPGVVVNPDGHAGATLAGVAARVLER